MLLVENYISKDMRTPIKKHLFAKWSPSLKILLTDLVVKSFVRENQRHSFNGWVTLLGPISKFCALSQVHGSAHAH